MKMVEPKSPDFPFSACHGSDYFNRLSGLHAFDYSCLNPPPITGLNRKS